MPMNNLSELSKPVRIHHDWNRASMRHCGKCDQWEMTVADADGIQTCASCYDAEWLSEWQNYAEAAEQRVSALLADNEAKDKRILELERANQSQDDHINQQQDRIDSLEKTNAGLGRELAAAGKQLVYSRDAIASWERKAISNFEECATMSQCIEELGKRLATPVRLPELLPALGEYESNILWAERDTHNATVGKCAESIRAAGFKCMGGEQ